MKVVNVSSVSMQSVIIIMQQLHYVCACFFKTKTSLYGRLFAMLYMNFEFIICQKNIRKHDISRSTSNMYKLACVELRKECVVMWKKNISFDL